MKLLLDEQLSSVIAQQLRDQGHDVVAAIEVGLTGATDDQVLSSAARDRRAVVTNNIKDFRPLHADYLKTIATHYGIIHVPSGKYSLKRAQLGPLITALALLLCQMPGDDALRDREYFL